MFHRGVILVPTYSGRQPDPRRPEFTLGRGGRSNITQHYLVKFALVPLHDTSPNTPQITAQTWEIPPLTYKCMEAHMYNYIYRVYIRGIYFIYRCRQTQALSSPGVFVLLYTISPKCDQVRLVRPSLFRWRHYHLIGYGPDDWCVSRSSRRHCAGLYTRRRAPPSG